MENCPSCNSKNPVYSSVCKQCGNTLRNRVPNIDFWETFWNLIVFPSETMMKIVQAERKNFMMFLLFVIGGKFVLNADYLAVHLFHHEGFQLYNLKLVYSGYILIVFLAGLIARLSLKIGKHPIRLKDCYVVIIFSQIPLLASFILLFIPQYILWGRYLFTPDPSPFFLNAVLAFFFSFIELVLVLWSGVLLYHGYKKITNSRVFAITLSVIIFIVIHILPIFLQQKYFPGL